MIDHAMLRPNSTEEEIENGCKEAIELGLAAVVVNPAYVPLITKALKGSPVKVCSVIAFPFGVSTTEAKVFEARNALAQGAEEIDMVMNFSALRSGQSDLVFKDIKGVVDQARSISKKIIVKVILENCYLSEAEKKQACLLAVKAGADFVKTSTGFGTGGATLDDVRLMRKTVGPNVGVKAAGGIRTIEQALKMIEAGANRIGTSASASILQGLPR
jgi:deoxyribose-phosphate aldolase